MGAPVILITGALTGIGRTTAFAFAKEGATVVASGRHEAEGKALEAELRSLGAEAAFILADVRHEDDVRNLVEQTVARFGRLDVAVNNAGTEGKPGPLVEQTSESYAGMFDTNVLGTLLSLKHELRVMQPQGSGSIINISSTMGERGAANLALYTASKHAVEGLTKSAALEAAPLGVRVNAVAPGPTETAMLDRLTRTPDKKAAFYAAIPLKRGAEPEEIADAIVSLIRFQRLLPLYAGLDHGLGQVDENFSPRSPNVRSYRIALRVGDRGRNDVATSAKLPACPRRCPVVRWNRELQAVAA